MECLLVRHRCRLVAAFEFDLRDFRQQLRFRICSRMTISADGPDRIRILLKQFHRQNCGAIDRPHCLMRRTLESFGHRLRRVVTIDASDLAGAIGAALFRDVLEVVNDAASTIRDQPPATAGGSDLNSD